MFMNKTSWIMGVALMGGLFLSGCGEPEQLISEVNVELGNLVPLDVDNYFQVKDCEISKFEVDNSRIDETKCGDYVLIFTYKDDIYEVNVSIEDTIAPILEKREVFEVECGTLFKINDFDLRIIDESETYIDIADSTKEKFGANRELINIEFENAKVNNDGYYVDSNTGEDYLWINEVGRYELDVAVEDACGNKNIERIEINVIDTVAPSIEGIDSLSIEKGKEIDLLAGVTAMDNVDGDITDKISITEIDVMEAGEQTCIYTVSDSSGNSVSAERKIEVIEKKSTDDVITPSAVRASSTSLACTSISVSYGYWGKRGTAFTRTFPPDVTVGEVKNAGNSEGAIMNFSQLYLTFSNGAETIVLDMGEMCNVHGEENDKFWWDYKIIAHQTISYENFLAECYMIEGGNVLMDQEGMRISSSFWPDQMTEWFGPYGFNHDNWIYY